MNYALIIFIFHYPNQAVCACSVLCLGNSGRTTIPSLSNQQYGKYSIIHRDKLIVLSVNLQRTRY
jgi:hypothetical protein